MSLRGKFVSVTFAGQCESAGVRKNSGLVNQVVDLAVGGFDFALKAGFPQVKIDPRSPTFHLPVARRQPNRPSCIVCENSGQALSI